MARRHHRDIVWDFAWLEETSTYLVALETGVSFFFGIFSADS